MRENSNKGFIAALGLASVWFGTHVGGGFATGNQTRQYFVQYGWPSIFIPGLVIVLLGWCYYNSVIMARNNQVFRYDLFAEILYSPFPKLGKYIFDISYVILVIVGAGIAIAGGGALFEELFGMNYYLGITITGLVFFVLTIFGASIVRKASMAITLFILICLLIILVPGLKNSWQNAMEIVSSRQLYGTWGSVIWSALLYAGYQSLVAVTLVSTSQSVKTKKDSIWFLILGIIMNGTMITLCGLMILGYLPLVGDNNLPIFTIIESLEIPMLLWVYSTILYLAFISTGVGVVFGLVARFEETVMPNSSITKRRVIISAISILGAVVLSLAGLTKLVAVGYGWIGRVSVFTIVIPLAIIAPIKNAKFNKTS